MDMGGYVYRPNRSGWPEGPWMGESDHEDWVDPASGLGCSLRRNFAGIWCGYVGVPRGHPAHGRRRVPGLRGGVEVGYAGPDRLGVPGDGDWYLGFVCGGLSPALSHVVRAAARGVPGLSGIHEAFAYETYRGVDEARAGCAALAEALRAFAAR